MSVDDVLSLDEIKKFLRGKLNKDDKVAIYNEFSLQHELGIYLRKHLNDKYSIEFERNITFFKLNKKIYQKREIDIVIYTEGMKEKYAIELKYPAHNNGVTGEYPERMKQFDKDYTFMKKLSKEFTETYCIVLVDDTNFYMGKFNEGSKNEEYYRKYRHANFWKVIDKERPYRFYIKRFKNGKEL